MSEEKLWLFDGSNFDNWKFRIEVLMEDRNMLGCLMKAIDEEEYARELATDTEEIIIRKKKQLEERLALDRKCKNLLIHRISEDQLEYVKDKKTAKDVWDALRNAFERVGIAGKLILKKQFQELKLAEGGDVKAFLLHFEKILRELRAAEVNMQEDDVVCQLLLALPKSYEALITALETIQPDHLTLEYVKKRLLDEQVKRVNSNPASDAGCSGESAFAGKKSRIQCFGCKKFGHKRAECPENRPAEESGTVRNRKSGGKFRKQKFGANVAEELTFVATTTVEHSSVAMMSKKTVDWILDSGATDHMVGNKKLFDEMHPLNRKVRIAVAKSGEALIAEYAGSVKVNMLIGKARVPAVVKDVLYVPQLECNLFSVRRIEENGMVVKFANGKATIRKDDRVVATGRRAGQLYKLNIELRDLSDTVAGSACEAGAMTTKKEVINLWHRRLGHLGTASMKTLWKHGMVETKTKISDWPEQCICEVCLQGKQTKKRFDDAGGRRASRPLETIHSDVCGPFTPRTWDNKRFFVTFIDDFSHFTVVYLLESKDEVQSKFEEYCARVTAYFGTRVSRLRCDNGGEYTGKSFRKFCRAQGISVEATVPYNPQQNGVAERMNRTLLEKSRSMVHDAGLNKSMWGEAILTAAYVCNRSPTSALNEKKTPYEVWYGKKPNIDKMRVFGCAAYTWVPREKRGKLDPKSEKNVMIGYTVNGYRVWDPCKRKMSIARDVVFDEKQDGAGVPDNDVKPVLYRSGETGDSGEQPKSIVFEPVWNNHQTRSMTSLR